MRKYILSMVCGICLMGLANAANAQLSCEKLGYTMVVADCTDDRILKCPFDENYVFCDTTGKSVNGSVGDLSDCVVGSILYSDKKCYVNPPTGVKAIGVVFDDVNRLAVYLADAGNKVWSDSASPSVDVCDFFNGVGFGGCPNSGYENSEKMRINDLSIGSGDSKYAVNYCYNDLYDKTGYHWFLPSLSEMNELLNNRKRVELGFYRQGIKNFFGTDVERKFLTSNVSTTTDCYIITTSYDITTQSKSLASYVACVLEY